MDLKQLIIQSIIDGFDPAEHKIVYTRPDGGVSIVIAATVEDIRRCIEHQDMSYEEYVEHVFVRSVPADATNVRVVTNDKLPNDRTFRDAWTDNAPTDTVDVDMDKAKVIHLDRMRAVRKPLLKQLDIDFMKALEIGSDTTEIVAKKQALRDVTATDLSKIKTPEALQAVWPDILNSEEAVG